VTLNIRGFVDLSDFPGFNADGFAVPLHTYESVEKGLVESRTSTAAII
jgi:hypothetical protein